MKENEKDVLRILLSMLVPPVGVYFQTGWSLALLVNIVLTSIGYVPGVIHAIWIIVKKGGGRGAI